jgi:hypothetical protein
MKESRFAWRRASRGLVFIGFGVFFFLSTQGVLHRGFWMDAMYFWPVCLIALGLRIMFERSKAPWAVLLSPLILMGTLSYVALRGGEPLPDDWKPVQAARDAEVQAWSLEATMALADLDLRAGPVPAGMLLQGRTAPSNRGSVRVSDRGDSSRVYLRGGRWRSGSIHVLPGRRHRWDIDVADDLPLTLQLEMVFAGGELDLAPIEVRRVDLDGAFNDLTLRLGAPETDVRVDLEGAFNRLELVVPADTPVRVSTDGFVNLVDRRSNASKLTGPGYRVRSDGAFNRVVIRSE